MKKVARVRWISNFDMENLISSILQNGIALSIGLILAGLLFRWAEGSQASFQEFIQSVSIPTLLLADFHRLGSPGTWPSVLMHLGVIVLLVTPYVRVAASMIYFAAVERNWKQALLTGFVLIVLTITLFTDLV